MDLFLQNLPKIELHAHLNGSLNTQGIKQLGQQLYDCNSKEFLNLCERFIDFGNTDLDGCFQKFTLVHELTSTAKGLKLACEMVIRDFAADNVIYLELRSTPKANKHMSRREYVQTLIESINEYGVLYNINVKLLLSVDRARSVESAEETVNLTLEFNEKYPDIVKGVDFSGNPCKGKFIDFRDILCKAKESKLKLALHCAEISNTEEAQQMLDFGFDRCGHGTFLTEDQVLYCGNRNITIECCLTSNVKCKTVASYDNHHFKEMFTNNIKTVLCTDDSGVFDTTLTEEFKLACKYFRLSMKDIYTLSINAIEASFANSQEKCMLKKRIEMYYDQINK